MGIQINGQTDIISAAKGSFDLAGANITGTTGNINAVGIVTATGFVGNITGNINATGVSTIATLNITQSNPTRLNVTGISTFTTGPVLIGSGTSTGTASQPLQVTGGAYVSGDTGIGVTNPDVLFHLNGTNAYPASSGSTPTGYLGLRRKAQGGTHGLYVGVAPASPWGSWLQSQDANNLATNYPLLLNPNGGNIGIGSATPGFQLTVDQGTTDGNLFYLKNEELGLLTGVWGTGSTYPREVTLNATRVDSGSSPSLRLAGQGGIKFAVDLNTVQGTINSYGEFRIGTAEDNAVSTDRVHTIGSVSIASVQTNLARLIMQERLGNWISFKNGSGTHYGTISLSGSGVSYGSNSDYRLKENVLPLSNSIERVKNLKPVSFNFISSPDVEVDGFLAHEVQEVAPYAVTGEKDGYDISGDVLDSDGKIIKSFVPEPSPEKLEEGQTWVETSREVKIQQLDTGKLVPLLTAALQEALSEIEILKARLDAAGL
jgi:Chaperone of endosialidase